MPSTKGLYESVTNQIVQSLEEGVKPWSKAWKVGQSGTCIVPTNAASGRHYSGMNVLLLWGAAIEREYPTHGWMTFRQANDLKGRVRKSEKSTTVIYTKFKNTADEGQPEKLVPMLKAYSVFNVAQIDGLPGTPPPEPWPEEARLDALKKMTEATGITVRYGAGKPCYMPGPDVVDMPNYGMFKTPDDFASTLGHELAHATGHPSRLNRKFNSKVFKENYAQEECVAELASCFLCAHLGFSYMDAQSPAYLDSWLKVLKQDARAIFSIASYASHASDWIRERQHAVTENTPDCEKLPPQEGSEIAA